MLEYFLGAGEPRKLSARIFVYIIHFVCVIIVNYHKLRKYFKTEINTRNLIFHTKFLQITVQPLHCLVEFVSLTSRRLTQVSPGGQLEIQGQSGKLGLQVFVNREKYVVL